MHPLRAIDARPAAMDGAQEEAAFTKDGSANLWKEPVLRSKTGRWKACSFLIVFNTGERMVFYSILSNLVNYLTAKAGQGTVTATKNVNDWAGATWIMAIFGACIADGYLGRYWAFCVFNVVYALGMILLVGCVSLRFLKPSACESSPGHCMKHSAYKMGILYLALYSISVGAGGAKALASTIGADQFDEFHEKEKRQKASFFSWWMLSVFLGSFIGQTLLIYVQEDVGFAWGYGMLAITLLVSLAVFAAGTPFYRHKWDLENPFKVVLRVLVAAASRWRVPVSSDPSHFHELEPHVYSSQRRQPLTATPILRCLDKAAMKRGSGEARPWILCTVSQVEETKLIIQMIPVVLSLLVPAIILSQVNTLFVKQATTLNRKIGSHFEIPAGSLTGIVTLSMMVTLVLYERFLIRHLKRLTGNPRGLTTLQRIGVGFTFQAISMMVASVADAKRIHLVKQEGLIHKPNATVPLSVFVLVPQLVLAGIANAFFETGLLEFFYEEAPRSMKSTATSFLFVMLGLSYFASSLLLTTVNRITRNFGRHLGWVQNDLNASRLYYYYALLSVLACLNLLSFIRFSRSYVYRDANVQSPDSPPKTYETCHSDLSGTT